MKQMLYLLVFMAIVVVGIGFYRGWYVLTNEREIRSNKVGFNLTVDPDKAKSDVNHATSIK